MRKNDVRLFSMIAAVTLLHVALGQPAAGADARYPFFYKNVPYNSERDLLPVTMVAKSVGFVIGIVPG